jgi:hypothetical protein
MGERDHCACQRPDCGVVVAGERDLDIAVKPLLGLSPTDCCLARPEVLCGVIDGVAQQFGD